MAMRGNYPGQPWMWRGLSTAATARTWSSFASEKPLSRWIASDREVANAEIAGPER